MIQVLLVVQVLVCTALIGIILLQRSDTDGFGLGSGSGSNFMSGRATANLLTRTTAILAAAFIINSLALGILAARGHSRSIADTIVEQESTVPQVPVAEQGTAKALGNEATEKVIAPAAAPAAKKKPAVKKPVEEEAPEVPEAE